ncbi:hypothetical protein FQR65_LT02209 [Abscondita terminalis]|nr:hypothetical protein FQR65_LT02209 [Abscondita terminalis]
MIKWTAEMQSTEGDIKSDIGRVTTFSPSPQCAILQLQPGLSGLRTQTIKKAIVDPVNDFESGKYPYGDQNFSSDSLYDYKPDNESDSDESVITKNLESNQATPKSGKEKAFRDEIQAQQKNIYLRY